jgi:hypothetical protein
MNEHFQINDEEWAKLQAKGWDVRKLYYIMGQFGKAGGLLGLLYHIDSEGTIEHDVASAMFNSLNNKEKLQVLEYLERAKENFAEDDEIIFGDS